MSQINVEQVYSKILCPIELILTLKMIPLMFIIARYIGAQHGLKGQYVLLPADLKNIRKYFQDLLVRSI